jgi:hypothetical protein
VLLTSLWDASSGTGPGSAGERMESGQSRLHNQPMPPTSRRAKMLRLLAHIDQQIQEARSLIAHQTLSAQEKRFARVHLRWRRQALKRVEAMLQESDSGG